MNKTVNQKTRRAKELLLTVRHAAMATVNEDGSPHNTPYFFMRSDDLAFLYWGSSPDSQHSKNIERNGQIFVVLYDAVERGGLYIRADEAHATKGKELEAALAVHNVYRAKEGKELLPLSYYQASGTQRMYMATIRQFWVNASERGADGLLIHDYRQEVSRESLLG